MTSTSDYADPTKQARDPPPWHISASRNPFATALGDTRRKFFAGALRFQFSASIIDGFLKNRRQL